MRPGCRRGRSRRTLLHEHARRDLSAIVFNEGERGAIDSVEVNTEPTVEGTVVAVACVGAQLTTAIRVWRSVTAAQCEGVVGRAAGREVFISDAGKRQAAGCGGEFSDVIHFGGLPRRCPQIGA